MFKQPGSLSKATGFRSRGDINTEGSIMRSVRGFWAGLVILLALPIAIFYQLLFGNGAEIVILVLLAVGSLLLALAVFDFDRVPKWITWIACLGAVAEGTIFLLQGLSHLIQDAAFTQLVYQGLGQSERVFMDLIIFWCVALWLADSWGKTRLLGLIALVSVISLEVYLYYMSFVNGSIYATAPGLRLLYLLLFLWLLLESSKKIAPMYSLGSSIQQKEPR